LYHVHDGLQVRSDDLLHSGYIAQFIELHVDELLNDRLEHDVEGFVLQMKIDRLFHEHTKLPY
jgi:hypothetical protein